MSNYGKRVDVNRFWQNVKIWSHKVGDFQARLILTFLYGLLVLPTGLIARIGGDLLESRSQKADSYWRARSTPAETIRQAREQG